MNSRLDAALQNEILEQPADVVVGKSGADGGFEPETAAQSSRDVVFAAAFPDFEVTRGANPAFSRIQPQHDLAKRDQVVLAGSRRSDFQWRHTLFYPATAL